MTTGPMTPQSGGMGSGELKRISRRTVLRAVAAALVIASGVVVMHGVERICGLTFTKKPMPLQKRLEDMNRRIGDPVRYLAEGPDRTMSEDILEVLGTRDYLLRRYVDQSKGADSAVGPLQLNLNYYATGSSTPHVPEICWAGAGMVEAANSRKIFYIPNVVRHDGRVVTLAMNMISFQAPDAVDPGKEKNVAYMFAVNGDYVATPAEVTSRFWKASNKYAWDAKIEVTVGDGNQFCTQEAAEKAVSAFIRAALPAIEECLPDPNYVAPDAATGRGGETATGRGGDAAMGRRGDAAILGGATPQALLGADRGNGTFIQG